MPHWNEARVVRRTDLSPDTFLLDLEDRAMASETLAGQFVMLHRDEGDFPFLPRPFSVGDVPDDRSIRLLIQAIGPGTRSLGRLEPGDALAMWGPLGNHFGCTGEFDHAILVAGGIGLAPFPLLVRDLRRFHPSLGRITLLYGARSESHLVLLDALDGLGIEIHLATDDGSRGFHGNTVDLLRREMARRDRGRVRIYGCGPEPMLDALARYTVSEGLPCQLSLERMMGCGVGACLGCVVATKAEPPGDYDYTKTCTDGPVLDAERLWLGAETR